MRDLLSWVAFFDVTEESLGPEYALLHGVFLVLLDGLSLGTFGLLSDFSFLQLSLISFIITIWNNFFLNLIFFLNLWHHLIHLVDPTS